MAPPLVDIADILSPRRTALLVIDLQNDFVHPEGWSARHAPDDPSLRPVIPVVNRLIAAARRSVVRIAYILMEHGPDIDAPNYRARYATRGMEDDILCRAGGWGAELDAEVTPPAGGDIVVCRHSYDGFAGTTLAAELRRHGVETCVATGVVTNLCVQTTIHHAFALGFYVALARDGTAASTATAHEAALDTFRRFFGPVLSGEAIAGHWTHATADAALQP